MAYIREYPRESIYALNNIFERFLSRQMYEFYNGLLSDFISAHRKFHSWDLFAEVWEVRWRGTFYPVADLGEGPWGGGLPPYFYIKLRPEGPKKFFWKPGIPLVSGTGWLPPAHPPTYLNVWIRHCYHLVNLKQLPMAFSYFSAKQ